ncbi:MAG: hypothetical protein KBS52_05520, partial [Clostridiales bacterium]|nr:hypothetical protein [Candidatus Equinaster intestinalis]
FVVAVIVTIFIGMIRLFKKSVPLYFSLHVCGVWCFAIGLIYDVLMIVCGETYNEVCSLDSLAVAGMFVFFASASYGTFDSIVDDRSKKNRPIRAISLFAALLTVAVCILELIYMKDTKGLSTLSIILFSLEKIPMPFCVYFSVKFLLMKNRGDQMLKSIKPLNICTLLACCGLLLYYFFDILDNDAGINISYYIYAISIVAEIFLADWGRKKWQS